MLMIMRWLKSFLSPTISSGWRECRSGVVIVLALAIGSVAARAVTPTCGPNSTSQVLRLSRRAAKKLLLNATRPSYPALARINYIGGRVQLLVTIGCRGKVEEIHVVHGHPFLAVAALDAIRRWVYHPFETLTGPAAFQTVVNVNFSLIDRDFTMPSLPPQPEKFLARWVHPPMIVSSPSNPGANSRVRLRVLVTKRGRVVDSTLLSGTESQFAAARKAVARWKLRPARWGNLNVPWYMEVDVPVHEGPGPEHQALQPSRTPASGVGHE